MELRPNRVKRKLAAGENAIVVSGLVHADAIDAFGPSGPMASGLKASMAV